MLFVVISQKLISSVFTFRSFNNLSRIFSFLGFRSSQRFTPSCDCPVDTELIHWVYNPIQELHILRFSTVMNGVFYALSPRFNTLIPLSTGCPVSSIFQHSGTNGIPSSFWFANIPTKPLFFASRSHECPIVLSQISKAYSWIFVDVNVQDAKFPFLLRSMSLNIDMKMILSLNSSGSMRAPSRSLWIFLKNLQCCESCKQFPLEFNWFSIHSQ